MMKKKMAKFGIDPNDLGIFTRPEYKLAHDKKTQWLQAFWVNVGRLIKSMIDSYKLSIFFYT